MLNYQLSRITPLSVAWSRLVRQLSAASRSGHHIPDQWPVVVAPTCQVRRRFYRGKLCITGKLGILGSVRVSRVKFRVSFVVSFTGRVVPPSSKLT